MSARDDIALALHDRECPRRCELGSGWSAFYSQADAVLAYLRERGIDLDGLLTRARDGADARGDS